MTTLQLRPRGFSELIDATFALIRARLRPIATVGALMILPGALMTLAMAALAPDVATPSTNPTSLEGMGATFWLLMAVLVPISIVAYALGATALVGIASSAYLGGNADMSEGFALGRRRMWPVIGQWILKWVLVFGPITVLAIVVGAVAASAGAAGGASGGLAVAGIGGLMMFAWMIVAPILLLRWAVSMPAAALEDVGASGALRRSGVLTKGSKGRLFWLYLVFFCVFVAMYAVGAMVGAMTGALFNSPVFANVLGNVMSMVLYPLLAVLQTVIYYDLRIRNEGYDLEVMAGGLADGASSVLPPAQAMPATPRQHA